METPLCTIIIPSYNHGKYLERSVKSALSQTYPNVEIIVVDDGSTDDTPQIMRKFQDSVRYIRKENTGRGHNRNVAIEASKGKYIQFLDADDYINEKKIALQVPILESNPSLGAVYSDCSCNDADGNLIENVAYPLKENEDQIEILLGRTLFGIHAALVRRDVILEVGMFDTDPLAQEDWDLWLQIALKGYKYKYMPGYLAHYDQIGSATVTNSPLMYKRTKHMLNKYINDPFFQRMGHDVVNLFIANQSLQLATRAYNNRWWREARKYFRMAKNAKYDFLTSEFKQCISKSYIHQFKDFIMRRKPEIILD